MTTYTLTAIDVAPGSYTTVHGLNDSGQVVGAHWDPISGFINGFIWTAGIYTTYNYFYNFHYFSINDAGDIVGVPSLVRQADNNPLGSEGNLSLYGAPWTYSATFQIIASTEPRDINDSGQVVGYTSNFSGGQSFGFILQYNYWSSVQDDPNSWTMLTGPAGATSVYADGINDFGDVVGAYSDSNGYSHGFLYSGGVYETIDAPYAANTYLVDINDDGDIIGMSYDTNSSTWQNFIYSNGSFELFDDVSGSFVFITGINNSDQITGYYNDQNGMTRGFLASPEHEIDPITNAVNLENIVGEMALLADNAYDRNGYGSGVASAHSRSNWQPADLALLSGHTDGLQFSYSSGEYSAIRTDIVLGLPSAEANAIVLTGLVNGERTLVVAFRGTSPNLIDGFLDAQDFTNFGDHFEKFAPLVDALKAYISSAGIEQVYVAGHSLGGTMVQYLLNEDLGDLNDLNINGYTWGSPGARIVPDNDNIVNFIHPDDPVVALGQLLVTERAGTDIVINSAILNEDNTSIDHHRMTYYVTDTLLANAYARDPNNAFALTGAGAALRDGTAWAGDEIYGNDIQLMPGTHLADSVHISSDDNFVFADAGDDQIVWEGAAGNTATFIDGGAGIDVLELPGLRTDWYWFRNGDAFDLFTTDALAARFTDIEILRFNETTFDLRNPSVQLSATMTSLLAGEVSTVTFAFDRVVLGFDLADIRVTGGELSSLTQIDTTHYTGRFTPDATNALQGSIQVLASGSGSSAWYDFDVKPGNASSVVYITGDTLAPLVDVRLTTDTGRSATDGNTSVALLNGLGEPNRLVSLNVDGGESILTTMTDFAGRWSANLNWLPDGEHEVGVTSEDAAGNVSSALMEFTLDTTNPAVSIFDVTQSGSKKSIQTTVSGHAEAFSSVELWEGNTKVGQTVASPDGNWNIELSNLSDIVHIFTASATDPAGNTGLASLPVLVGSTKADKIGPYAGGALVISSAGADVIAASSGSDSFIFHTKFGKDTINGFDVTSDHLVFDHLLFSSVSDILAHTKDVKGNAVIAYDGANTITLVGVDTSHLIAHQDLFSIV